MAKQHVTIFKALGLPQADIDAIEALTEDKLGEWKPDTILESIRGSVKTALGNDSSFLDTITEEKVPKLAKAIEKNQYARFQNELIDVATKELGLEDKDLTEEDRKSIKKLAGKMATLYLSKKGNVEGLKKMQDELNEARAANAKKDEDWSAKVKSETEGLTTKYSSRLMKTLLQSELSSLDKIKLNVGAAYLTDPILNKLKSKYHVVLNDNDELDIKQKENNVLDVFDKVGKKVPFKSALREIVIEEKLGVEEVVTPGGPTPPKKVVIGGDPEKPGEGEEVKVADYIQESIDKQIALEGK